MRKQHLIIVRQAVRSIIRSLLIFLSIGFIRSSRNIVRVIKCRRLRWADHVAKMEEGGSAFKVLTGRHTAKIRLGRRRWEGNIRMDLEEIGINTRNWVDSAQDRDY